MPLSRARDAARMARRRAAAHKRDAVALGVALQAVMAQEENSILSPEQRRVILSGIAQLTPQVRDPIRAIDVLNRMDNLYVTKVDQRVIGRVQVEVIPFGISTEPEQET